MAEYRQDWADYIAKTIEQDLILIQNNKADEPDFVNDLAKFDIDLYNSRNIKDTQLFCVYILADSYFDAIYDPQETVDGVPINIAKDILLDCVEKLKRGEKIDNPKVLRYSHFRYSVIDHLKKRIRSLFHRK